MSLSDPLVLHRDAGAVSPRHAPARLDGSMADAQSLTFTVETAMAPLEREWRKLEADDRLSLHQSYDWCRAWVETHDHPLAIVTARQNGRLMMLLPLEVTRSAMIGTARFIGARFNNINTGLFSRDWLDHPPAGLARRLAAEIATALRDHADLVALSNIPLTWRGMIHPLSGLDAVEHQNHAFQLPLKASMDETIAQLNRKKRRKRYSKQSRRIEELGGYDHLVASTPEENQRLLSAFFRQKARRFETLGLPDVFRAPETQAFFQMLAETEVGSVQAPLTLHALRLKGEYDGHIAAISGQSRKGDHIIFQFGSIDETVLPELSPGDFLYWLIIEQAIAEGATLIDFGLGDQQYKRAWCCIETVQHDLLLPVTPLGSLAASVEKGLTRAKAKIKAHRGLYTAIQRLRAGRSRPAETAEAAED